MNPFAIDPPRELADELCVFFNLAVTRLSWRDLRFGELFLDGNFYAAADSKFKFDLVFLLDIRFEGETYAS